MVQKRKRKVIKGSGMKVDTKKKVCRFRQMSPKKCQKKSFRAKRVNEKTILILCRKKRNKKLALQSIIKKRNGGTCELVKKKAKKK